MIRSTPGGPAARKLAANAGGCPRHKLNFGQKFSEEEMATPLQHSLPEDSMTESLAGCSPGHTESDMTEPLSTHICTYMRAC